MTLWAGHLRTDSLQNPQDGTKALLLGILTTEQASFKEGNGGRRCQIVVLHIPCLAKVQLLVLSAEFLVGSSPLEDL